LGSTKFPEKYDLFNYVKKKSRSGYANAFTRAMTTAFFASTVTSEVRAVSERIADMLHSPLFPEKAVREEIKAIDCEYHLRQHDIIKYCQLLHSLSTKGHPLRKMDCGNMETLKIDNFSGRLAAWKKKHYTAGKITLLIRASKPIQELEKIVVEYFSAIQADCIPVPNPMDMLLSPALAFKNKTFHSIYHVKTINKAHNMTLHWALDSQYWKNMDVKPLMYLGVLLSFRGAGGLRDYLRRKGLVLEMFAGCYEDDYLRNPYVSMFAIQFDLTQKGFEDTGEVLLATFSYIKMLSNKSVHHQSFFQYLQMLNAEFFHYVEPDADMVDQQIAQCQWLQWMCPKQVMLASVCTTNFNERCILDTVKNLRADTVNIMLFTQALPKGRRKVLVERFYNTKYVVASFPSDLEGKLSNVRCRKDFRIPVPNELLSKGLYQCPLQLTKNPRPGKLILHIPQRLVILYKGENLQSFHDGGQLPLATYEFSIASSALTSSLNSVTLVSLMCTLMQEMIERAFHPSLSHIIGVEFSAGASMMNFYIYGQSIPVFEMVKEILDIFFNLDTYLTRQEFHMLHTDFRETVENHVLDNFSYATSLNKYMLKEFQYLVSDQWSYLQSEFFMLNQYLICFVSGIKNTKYYSSNADISSKYFF